MSGARRALMLVSVLAAMMTGSINGASAQTATTVQDIVYGANGARASGSVLVSWNTFTTVDGQTMPAGSTSTMIGAGGLLTIALAPNAGSTPLGTYYTAIFRLSDGTTSREYWVIPVTVPGGGPATLAAIRDEVLSGGLAMRTAPNPYMARAIIATTVPLVPTPEAGSVTVPTAALTALTATISYVPVTGGTMTGPLVLPADPVNTNQAADKHYVDTSAAATAAGLGQKVSLLPTASQAVAQPSGTSFSIDGAYASTTFSGTGTSSQSVITSANTIASPTIGGYVQLTNTLNCFESGFDLGNNGTSAVGWSGCALDNDTEESATRGISQLHAGDFSHFAQGDTAAFYTYLTAFGGAVASSDEAVTHTVEHTNQIGYYSGVIATGGTTGSNLLTTNSFTCQGYCATLDNNQFADGGILLDMSKGASTATLASEGTALNGMYYTLASGTVTPSTAWGNIIPSTCTNNGNGFWQNYTSTTCNVTLGTSPASPGNFIAGQDIFLSGPFEEEAAVVTVGSPSGGVQSITFNTRYAWNSANGNTNAALVMQGGPGGQSIVAAGAVNSWPVAYPVVGATSPTQVFFSNCISGYCNGIVGSGNIIQLSSTNLFNAGATVTRTGNVVTLTAAVPGYRIYLLPIGASVVLSGFTPSDLNGTFTVTSNSEDANNFSVTWAQNGTNEASTAFGAVSQAPVAIAFYPSAFITGTNNGVAGNAQLATNTIPFATGDTVVGAPTSEFQNAGLNVYIGQNTPIDGSRASQGIMVNDGGPSQLARAYAALNKPANGVAGNMFYVNGSYADDFYFGYRPANNGSILFVQGNEPVSANAKAYNIFADNGSPGSAGTFSFNPLTGGFSLSGNLAASSIKATAAASAFAAGSTVGGILPCLQNGTNCPAGIGSVTAAQLPAATVLTQGAVLLPTGAITNILGAAAMLPGSIAINSSTCALGGTCTITAAPPSEIKYYPAAVCDGGTAYASGLTRYDNQQPQAGCVLPASSALGYLAFNAASTLPQYAEATVATPTYWTGTSLYIKFYSLAITGTATWYVQTACTNDGSVIGTSSFGTAVSIISTVSSISGAGVTTAVLSGIATPGTNGCTAGTTLPGSLLTYRIYRSATDTAAGNVNLLGITMVTGRSQ
jgi:hypothetical protein